MTMDQDRFKEYDMVPAKKEGKRYSWCEWNPETGKYEPPPRASSLTLDQWQKILDNPASVLTEDLVSAVMEGKSSQEPSPLVSGSRADRGDK